MQCDLITTSSVGTQRLIQPRTANKSNTYTIDTILNFSVAVCLSYHNCAMVKLELQGVAKTIPPTFLAMC